MISHKFSSPVPAFVTLLCFICNSAYRSLLDQETIFIRAPARPLFAGCFFFLHSIVSQNNSDTYSSFGIFYTFIFLLSLFLLHTLSFMFFSFYFLFSVVEILWVCFFSSFDAVEYVCVRAIYAQTKRHSILFVLCIVSSRYKWHERTFIVNIEKKIFPLLLAEWLTHV